MSADQIQLRLSAGALAALYPEGSAARIELQNAVAQEFIKKHIRPNSMKDEVMAFIKSSKEEAVRTVLAEIGVSTVSWNQKLTLSDTLKRELYAITKDELKKTIGVEIASAVELEAKRMLTNITKDLDQKIDAVTEAEIARRIQAKVTAALQSALR